MLMPPPRPVPLSLRIVNMFNVVAQIAWFVFGFGMIFFWAFCGSADYSFLTFRGPHEQTTGKITSIRETGASENRQRISEVHYQFSLAGEGFQGTSYTTGGAGSEGDEVTIEYSAKDPMKSRIAGMRRGMFGPAVLFVAIFPLIGLAILIPSTVMGLKRNRLLREGMLAMGTLKSKEATNMTVNKRRVFELRFDFTARDGQQHEAVARTSDTARLEDEAQEPLLYDPNEPSRAYLLDEAPARPQVEMNGELRGRTGAAIGSLIVPVLMISVQALIIYFKFVV